jgi:hypothetical protein
MVVEVLAYGVLAGLGATWTMDRLATVSRRAGLTAGLDRRWMGRWFLGFFRGRFMHTDISSSPAEHNENRAARIGHYAIGVALAVAYLGGAAAVGARPQGLALALGYGFATNVFPWFLMFPAMGFGVFGRKGPAERRLLRSSTATHAFYGLGLWWTALVLPVG